MTKTAAQELEEMFPTKPKTKEEKQADYEATRRGGKETDGYSHYVLQGVQAMARLAGDFTRFECALNCIMGQPTVFGVAFKGHMPWDPDIRMDNFRIANSCFDMGSQDGGIVLAGPKDAISITGNRATRCKVGTLKPKKARRK